MRNKCLECTAIYCKFHISKCFRNRFEKTDFSSYLICLLYFTCVIEYVPSNCFITRFRAAVSILVGPCCPALLNCIDVDVHTVVLLGK